MSENPDTDKYLGDHTAEEKLAILRAEMMTPISTIRGYSNLLKDKFSSANIDDLPNDFDEYIERIIQAGDTLHEIFEIVTGKPS